MYTYTTMSTDHCLFINDDLCCNDNDFTIVILVNCQCSREAIAAFWNIMAFSNHHDAEAFVFKKPSTVLALKWSMLYRWSYTVVAYWNYQTSFLNQYKKKFLLQTPFSVNKGYATKCDHSTHAFMRYCMVLSYIV